MLSTAASTVLMERVSDDVTDHDVLIEKIVEAQTQLEAHGIEHSSIRLVFNRTIQALSSYEPALGAQKLRSILNMMKMRFDTVSIRLSISRRTASAPDSAAGSGRSIAETSVTTDLDDLGNEQQKQRSKRRQTTDTDQASSKRRDQRVQLERRVPQTTNTESGSDGPLPPLSAPDSAADSAASAPHLTQFHQHSHEPPLQVQVQEEAETSFRPQNKGMKPYKHEEIKYFRQYCFHCLRSNPSTTKKRDRTNV